MGKRYYCDYCDRSFIDDIQARKKHLNGMSHIRNRKLHFLYCRDLKTFIEEESAKEECYKFRNSGMCSFGENCYRSHCTKEQLQRYKEQLIEEEKRKNSLLCAQLKSVDSWLQKKNTGIESYDTLSKSSSMYNAPNIMYESNFYNSVPSSLQPLNVGNLTDAEVSEW